MNYDEAVNIMNVSSCEWYRYGCMHTEAYNYNATANTDDGSCEFHSCGLNETFGYNGRNGFELVPASDCAEMATCTDTGPSTFSCTCFEGYMGLTRFDGRECVLIVEGCMELGAVNYDPLANLPTACHYAVDVFACNHQLNWVEGDLPRTGIAPGSAPDLVAQPVSFADTPEKCARRCLEIPACVFFELETVGPRCSLGFSVLQFDQPPIPPDPIDGCIDIRSALYTGTATRDDGSCEIDSCEWAHTIEQDCSPNATCQNTGWSNQMISSCPGGGTCSPASRTTSLWSDYTCTCADGFVDTHGDGTLCEVPLIVCTDSPACPTHYHTKAGSADVECVASPSLDGACDFSNDAVYPDTDEDYDADLASCCEENQCTAINAAGRAALGYVATANDYVTTALGIEDVSCVDDFYQTDSDVSPTVTCSDDDGLGDDAFVFSGCSPKGTCAASATAVTCGTGYVVKPDYNSLDGTDEAACCDPVTTCTAEPACPAGFKTKDNSQAALCSATTCDFTDDSATLGAADDSYIADLAACCTGNECSAMDTAARTAV
jgi:hypothetical protein